jgi:inhibitor of KinA
MPAAYTIYPIGDHALTIELGDRIDPDINRQCLDIARQLASANIHGLKDVIPGYTTVSLIYDPAEIFHLPNIVSPYQYIRQQAEEVIGRYRPSQQLTGRTITVPACFDTSFAPDLPLLAQQKNIPVETVIDIFLGRTYHVYMIGFLPGFAYMGKVDDAIATPRKEKPYAGVKPGSIGIAGSQAGIYPLTSPGGWNIVGRTPLKLFDKDSDDPCLLKAGDEIRFQQVTIDQFNQLNQNH